MKINRITLNFKNDKTLIVPSKGVFSDDLNLIYTSENNRYKTTLIRSILKAGFANSITMPKDKKNKLLSIVIEYLINSKIVTLKWTDKKTFITNQNNIVEYFESSDTSGIFKSIFNKDLKGMEDIRVSWIMENFLLDQDFDQGSALLLPSYYNIDAMQKWKIKHWLITGDAQSFDKTNSIKLKQINKELKVLEARINDFKNAKKVTITINNEYDSINLNEIGSEYKKNLSKFNKIKKREGEVNSLLNQIDAFRNGPSTEEKILSESIYLIGESTKTGKMNQFKANLKNLMNFTVEPISEGKDEIKKQYSELESELAFLKEKAKIVSIALEKQKNILNSYGKGQSNDYLDIMTNTFLDLFREKDDLVNLISDNKGELMQYKQAINETKESIRKDFNERMTRIMENRESSESGVDIFLEKFVKFLSFYSQINVIKFPALIDSIKERDPSDSNLESLIKETYILSNVKKTQIFLTMTSNKSIENNNIFKKYISKFEKID